MLPDDLRHSEFARLDLTETTYLDWTGAALYPESLVIRDTQRLLGRVLGNPHADNGPSQESSRTMEAARERTLRFFDADEQEYDVVFTANATAALRLIAEAFPFCPESRLVLTTDNHNSVNGLRGPAEKRGAAVEYVPLDRDLRGFDPAPWLPPVSAPSLFAYPAQSNFSGVHHPLTWVGDAQRNGYMVLLDAAAYVPSNQLSLREVPADFAAISFYKMFGYPTGVGALIARRKALRLLQRDYFAGGTVQFVSVRNALVRNKVGSAGFEDGTPNFLGLPAVCDGLDWLEQVGMQAVRGHVAELTKRLRSGLDALAGRVERYGPQSTEACGGSAAFNLYREGKLLTYEVVESAAHAWRIALRGGCFCNPGAAETAFDMQADRVRECLHGTFSIARLRENVAGPIGALRVSLGLANNEADVDQLLRFVAYITSEAQLSGEEALEARSICR